MKYKDAYSSLDKNDIFFLLVISIRVWGKYATISYFNSCSKNLNEVLGKAYWALYQQMVHYRKLGTVIAAGISYRSVFSDQYRLIHIIYISICWADMTAEEGQYETVQNTLQSYMQNRDVIMNRLLPQKIAILARVQNLDLDSYYANPSGETYKQLASQIDVIKGDLTNNYNELMSLKGIIYVDAIVNLHNEEIGMLDSLKIVLSDYYTKKIYAEETITRGTSLLQQIKKLSSSYERQLAIMDQILERQYELYKANDPQIQGNKYSDMELKRLYDLEKNIQLYTDLIEELDNYIADPKLVDMQAQLKIIRDDYDEKRTSLNLRKEYLLQVRKHSSDAQEQIFNTILQEYYALYPDKKNLDKQIMELEQFMKKKPRTFLPKKCVIRSKVMWLVTLPKLLIVINAMSPFARML